MKWKRSYKSYVRGQLVTRVLAPSSVADGESISARHLPNQRPLSNGIKELQDTVLLLGSNRIQARKRGARELPSTEKALLPKPRLSVISRVTGPHIDLRFH